MFKNYFLFEKQLNEIKPELLGRTISYIFTYRKNELILELSGPDPLFMHINISASLPYFFIQPAYNIRTPKYGLFDDLVSKTILDARILPYDKVIMIDSEEYRLICLFYGSKPNIFLADYDNNTIDAFKNGRLPDLLVSNNKTDFRRPDIDFSNLKNMELIELFLKNNFAAFNNTIIKEILFRLKEKRGSSGMESGSGRDLQNIIKDLSVEFDQPGAYLYYREQIIRKISLFRLIHLEKSENQEYKYFDSINEAWKRFSSEKTDKIEFDKLYKQCINAVHRKKSYLERSLRQIKAQKNIEERKKLAEIKGNLLLTFKNQINTGKNEVILENIFSNDLEKMRIKLNPHKSISENAQIYFNKYKDKNKMRLTQNIREDTLEDELNLISDLENKITNSGNLAGLRKIHSKLIELNLIQEASSSSRPVMPFKHLLLGKKWDVYIGKSGENNDALTFKFAKKYDYWFHAQGVPGSHVILRNPHGDQTPPKRIIEQAAGIAAASSKAKHSSTVPVIYTQVRYVSRIRNAPKGTVNVRNEKTIFVEPLNTV